MTKVKILVADANKVFAKRIASTLNDDVLFEVVGTSNSCREAFNKVFEFMPDVLLYSTNAAKREPDRLKRGTEVLHALLPSTKVIVLTEEEDINECTYVLSMGVRGYISRCIADESLKAILSTIQAGGVAISPMMVDKMLDKLIVLPNSERAMVKREQTQLTMREKEVIELAARGKRNKEIADSLHITENTVKCHMSSIFAKLGVFNRQSAAYLISSTSSNL